LRNVTTTLYDSGRDSDAGHREQSIDVVSSLFDLRELTFQAHPFRFRRRRLRVELLELVFNHSAPGTAGLACVRIRAPSELKRIRRFRLVLGHRCFALLQVRFEPLFFLEQISQRVLGEIGAALDRIANVFAADGFNQTLGEIWIFVQDIQIDQTCPPAHDGLHHQGKRAA
jgi:hypothetical protein